MRVGRMRIGIAAVVGFLVWAVGDAALERRESPLSPYEVNRLFRQNEPAALADLWPRLGICETLHSHQSACGTGMGANLKFCGSGCRTELHLLDVLPDPGLEIVLQVEDIDNAHSRLLVFRRLPPGTKNTERWELVDYIDSGWSKYGEVRVRTIELGGRKYFIMSETAGGTGVHQRYESWYEFQDDGAQKALVVVPEFLHAPLGLVWEAKTTFDSYQREGSSEVLRFNMELHYDDRQGYTFRRTVPVTYMRRAGEIRFEFNPVDSELAPEIAAEWHRIPSLPKEEVVWEYGILLGVVGLSGDQVERRKEEFRGRSFQ